MRTVLSEQLGQELHHIIMAEVSSAVSKGGFAWVPMIKLVHLGEATVAQAIPESLPFSETLKAMIRAGRRDLSQGELDRTVRYLKSFVAEFDVKVRSLAGGRSHRRRQLEAFVDSVREKARALLTDVQYDPVDELAYLALDIFATSQNCAGVLGGFLGNKTGREVPPAELTEVALEFGGFLLFCTALEAHRQLEGEAAGRLLDRLEDMTFVSFRTAWDAPNTDGRFLSSLPRREKARLSGSEEIEIMGSPDDLVPSLYEGELCERASRYWGHRNAQDPLATVDLLGSTVSEILDSPEDLTPAVQEMLDIYLESLGIDERVTWFASQEGRCPASSDAKDAEGVLDELLCAEDARDLAGLAAVSPDAWAEVISLHIGRLAAEAASDISQWCRFHLGTGLSDEQSGEIQANFNHYLLFAAVDACGVLGDYGAADFAERLVGTGGERGWDSWLDRYWAECEGKTPTYQDPEMHLAAKRLLGRDVTRSVNEGVDLTLLAIECAGRCEDALNLAERMKWVAGVGRMPALSVGQSGRGRKS